MVKIFTPYGKERPPKKASHPGNRMEIEYRERYTETGHPYLVKTGERDNYAAIQSYKDECDINLILQRYAAGDTSMIRPGGQYIDATEIPTSYHEIFNVLQSQKEKFDLLPVEIKQKFDNSFEVWAATSGTEDWVNKMGLKKNEPVKEVKQDEPKQ